MLAAFGVVLRIKTEVQKSIVMGTRFEYNIPAAATVAAAGAAAWHKLLTPERKTAVAAVASFHGNNYFIYEQWVWN